MDALGRQTGEINTETRYWVPLVPTVPLVPHLPVRHSSMIPNLDMTRCTAVHLPGSPLTTSVRHSCGAQGRRLLISELLKPARPGTVP